jgi:multidrug efflux system outer membrane protein
MFTTIARSLFPGLLLLAVTACTMGPDYRRPDVMVPLTYKQDAPWKAAEPRDAQARGAWWALYNDPVLDRLEEQAAEANQSLQAAYARLSQVQAGVGISEAERLPRLDLNASAQRSRLLLNQFGLDSSGPSAITFNYYNVPLAMNYEIDLWGRVKRSVEAARADSANAVADYQAALLSLQGEVARNYFTLRALDNEIALFEQTLVLLQEALDLVKSQYENGLVSGLSLAQAETELANTEAEAVGLRQQRSELVNTIAVLIGTPASDFSLAAAAHELQPPGIAPGLPSQLLERRPDIAAAERRMAASSARIGVAKTAFFPSISLTGNGGYSSGEIDALFAWDNRSWGFGPAVSLPIFDGGRNSANLERARLAYQEAIAEYRQQVLLAFQEVEDGLQGLEFLARQGELLRQALASARKALELSDQRYRSGYVSYIEVIDTQRTALQVARSLARVQGRQMTTSVLLIKALGGGWQTD